MKKIVFLVLALQILLMPKLFSQNHKSDTISEDVVIVSHTVSLGETVRLISQKYLVSPSDIYKRNKFAVDGVSPGMVLQIPVHKGSKSLGKKEIAKADAISTDEAVAKSVSTSSPRTIEAEAAKSAAIESSISTTESTSLASSELANDQGGFIPDNQMATAERKVNAAPETVEHHVKSGETLIGLGRKYGMTVAEIQEMNPVVKKRGLQIGQTLKMRANL